MEHIPAYLAGTEELSGHAQEFEHLADAHTAFNEDALSSAPERELSTLAKTAHSGAQRLIDTADDLDRELRYPWFGGVVILLSSYLAVAINEFLSTARTSPAPLAGDGLSTGAPPPWSLRASSRWSALHRP